MVPETESNACLYAPVFMVFYGFDFLIYSQIYSLFEMLLLQEAEVDQVEVARFGQLDAPMKGCLMLPCEGLKNVEPETWRNRASKGE